MSRRPSIRPRGKGSLFIHAAGLPAAVLTHLASFPGDTLVDIAEDIPTTTLAAVQCAAASLRCRGLITREGEVTTTGALAIHTMMRRG